LLGAITEKRSEPDVVKKSRTPSDNQLRKFSSRSDGAPKANTVLSELSCQCRRREFVSKRRVSESYFKVYISNGLELLPGAKLMLSTVWSTARIKQNPPGRSAAIKSAQLACLLQGRC